MYCGGEDATASEIPQNSLKPRNFKTIKQLLIVRIQQQLISSKKWGKLYCIRSVKKA